DLAVVVGCDVTRVGVDAYQSGDLAVDAGLLHYLAAGGLAHRLARLHAATWDRPVVVVGAPDEEDTALGVGDHYAHRGHEAVGFRRGGVIEVVGACHVRNPWLDRIAEPAPRRSRSIQRRYRTAGRPGCAAGV